VPLVPPVSVARVAVGSRLARPGRGVGRIMTQGSAVQCSRARSRHRATGWLQVAIPVPAAAVPVAAAVRGADRPVGLGGQTFPPARPASRLLQLSVQPSTRPDRRDGCTESCNNRLAGLGTRTPGSFGQPAWGSLA